LTRRKAISRPPIFQSKGADEASWPAEMFIKGSPVVTLANWQMCGEANAKVVLR
jgi:hypothetical protein